MNKVIKSIAVAMLLLGTASILDSCCKESSEPNVQNFVNVNVNTYGSLNGSFTLNDNHFNGSLTTNLFNATNSDTSYIFFDDVQLLRFVGDMGETKYEADITQGSHKIYCYTQGGNDTLNFPFTNPLPTINP